MPFGLGVRGLGNFRKRNHICQILKTTKVDVCFIQETHVYNNIVADMYSKDLGGKCYWPFGTSRAKGVGIWFKENFNCEMLLLNRDIHGRCLSVTVKINDVIMKMISVLCTGYSKGKETFLFFFI